MTFQLLCAPVYSRLCPKNNLKCLLAALYLCVALFEAPAWAEKTELPQTVQSKAGLADGAGASRRSGDRTEDLLKRLSRSVFTVELLDRQGFAVELGSGVALGPNQIVAHCPALELGRTLRIRQYAGSWPAVIAEADPEHDLCQLNVQGLTAPPVAIRPSATVSVGD